MSLTKRILIAMALGIVVGSLLEVLVPRLEPEGTAYQVVMNGLVFRALRCGWPDIYHPPQVYGGPFGLGDLGLRSKRARAK